MSRKLTQEEFVSKATSIHGNRYNYSKVNYIDNKTKIIISCTEHGDFLQIPNSHLLGKGCAICSNNTKLTTSDFIMKSNKVHNNKYDYSESNYINSTLKIKIICPTHGLFKQNAAHHMNGRGCVKCGVDIKKSSLDKFIIAASKIHNKYKYDKCIYVNNFTEVNVVCNEHGDFWQTPNSHLAGQGCPKCAKNYNLGIEKFIEKANFIHKDKYDYSKSKYINGTTKINITCKLHGDYFQTPQSHLSGSGCPKCVGTISEFETKWLDELKIPIQFRNMKLPNLGRKRVDGYDSSTNTVYEFYGDYWHGNPKKFNSNDINKSVNKTFGELYNATIQREYFIKSCGYNVVSLWEFDVI